MTTKRKSVFAQDFGIAVRIDITATAEKTDLTKDELTRLMSFITDAAMRTLNETPYLAAPLNKIKVR